MLKVTVAVNVIKLKKFREGKISWRKRGFLTIALAVIILFPPVRATTVQDTINGITLAAVANHQKSRVLLNTRAWVSFASSTFINHIIQRPVHWKSKEMETIIMTITQKLPAYKIQLHSTGEKHSINIKVNKLVRPVVTKLTNLRTTNIKRKYLHLSGLQFYNNDRKDQHPIHIILMAGDIEKLESSGFISEKAEEPVAEKTFFGSTLIGDGSEPSKLMYLTRISQDGYRQVHSLRNRRPTWRLPDNDPMSSRNSC